MAKVITFSRVFPRYHPKAGKPTYFIEKLHKSFDDKSKNIVSASVMGIFNFAVYNECKPKNHTIRSGHRFKAGEYFSPRVWSGKPYDSKQIIIAPDTPVLKTWSFAIMPYNYLMIDGKFHCDIEDQNKITEFAHSDGLNPQDLLDWFKYPQPLINHQIICWNESVNYDDE